MSLAAKTAVGRTGEEWIRESAATPNSWVKEPSRVICCAGSMPKRWRASSKARLRSWVERRLADPPMNAMSRWPSEQR